MAGRLSLTEVTYRQEQRRALVAGILETAGTTFLLLVAVRAFEAGALAKGLIAAGGSLGLLLTPFTVSVVARLRMPVTRAAAWISGFGGACYAAAALVPWLPLYVAFCVGALTAGLALVPLLTQMFEENYPDSERGRRFSNTVVIRILASIGFSWLGGRVLSDHVGDRYPVILLVYAGAFLCSAWCLLRVPTRPITLAGGSHPFRAWRYLRDDRVFRTTLISWMLMGFGNLMMLPLRVDYLANPRYQLALPAMQVALLTGVVPNISRLIMIGVWGRLFDRMNFHAMRATLNVGFAVGILAFFTGDSMGWLIFGGIVFGISNAGGDISWSLWVTKLAPPGRAADYMSVHTFLNGIRSALAPVLAFLVVEHTPITTLGWVSVGLIVVSTLILIPEIRSDSAGRRWRRRSAVVTEKPDLQE